MEKLQISQEDPQTPTRRTPLAAPPTRCKSPAAPKIAHKIVSERLGSPPKPETQEKQSEDQKVNIDTPLKSNRASVTPEQTSKSPKDKDKEDIFWLGSRQSPRRRTMSDKPSPARQTPSLPLHTQRSFVSTKPNANAAHGEREDLSAKTDSESYPPLTVHHNFLLTVSKEEQFFGAVYNALDHGFKKWEVKYDGRGLKFMDYDERVIDLPIMYDNRVTFGRRPDQEGFWRGFIKFGPSNEVFKLDTGDRIILGVAIGGIKDFDCMSGARVFAGLDRMMYYTDRDGWFDQDERNGMLKMLVCGPYEIRDLGARHVLNPHPTSRCPDIWVPSEHYRGRTNVSLIEL